MLVSLTDQVFKNNRHAAAKIPGVRLSWRLNFERRYLIFACPQYKNVRCVTHLASRNLKFPTDLRKICSSLNPHTADSFKERQQTVMYFRPIQKFCKLYYGISSVDVAVSSDGQVTRVLQPVFHIRIVTLGVKIMEVWHRHLSILRRNKTFQRIRSRCAKRVGALCAHRNSLILNKGSKPNVQTASQYGPTNH